MSVNLELKVSSFWDYVFLVIFLLYTIPSQFLGGYLLVVMTRSKKCIFPYYRTVRVYIFLNMVCCMNSWLAFRLINYEFAIPFLKFIEENVPGLLNFHIYGIHFFMHMQPWAVVGLSVHRIASVKGWRRSGYCTIAMYVSGLVVSLSVTLWQGIAYRYKIIDSFLHTIYNEESGNKISSIDLGFCGFYMVLYMIITLCSYYYSKKMKRRGVISYTNVVIDKLTAISFIIWFASLPNLLFVVISWFDIDLPFFVENKIAILGFCTDLMTLHFAWCFMFYDSNVQEVRTRLFCKGTVQVTGHSSRTILPIYY